MSPPLRRLFIFLSIGPILFAQVQCTKNATGAAVEAAIRDGYRKKRAGDLEGALAEFDRAILQAPNDPKSSGAYCGRAELRRKRGDVDGAMADANKAIEIDPNNSDGYVERGATRWKAGDLAGALADADVAVKWNPESFGAYDFRGVIRETSRDFEGAIADYTKALKLSPGDSDCLRGRGEARLETGDTQGAIADFSQVIERDPKDVSAHYGRAGALMKQNRIAEAIADFTKIIEFQPNVAKAYNSRGFARLYRQQKSPKVDPPELELAVVDFDRAIELDPTIPQPYGNRGQVRRLLGDNAKAAEDFDKLIRLAPDEKLAYARRADFRRSTGDAEGALADFAKAVEIDPKFIPAIRGKGLVFAGLQKWENAAEEFSRCLAVKPDDLYPALYRWVMQSHLGKDAASPLRDALQRAHPAEARRGQDTAGPDDYWTATLARFLLGEMDWSALLADAEKADNPAGANGRRCEANYFQGCVLLTAGRKEHAVRNFKDCMATEEKTFIEYELARNELARLEGKE